MKFTTHFATTFFYYQIVSLILYLDAPFSDLEQVTVWLLAFIRVHFLTMIHSMLVGRSLNHVAYFVALY